MGDIPANVKKCASILKAAKNDTEKFAALFMAAKLTKGNDCSTKCKKLLFEAIGSEFLGRLLCSDDAPTDCPPQIYKSVALSIISCFSADEDLASHKNMIALVPSLLEVIQVSETDDSDDNLMIVSEAYKCLMCITECSEGLMSVASIGGISKICDVYLQQTFQTDKALDILVKLFVLSESKQWARENNEQYKALLDKVALDFRTDHSERKFELCSILFQILMQASKSNLSSWKTEMWPSYLREGLKSILSSKITKHQRDPALKLVSIIIDILGVEWSLTEEEKPKQFLLLLIHLCSVEVRMQLEDRSLKEILSNAELVVSCFLVLEITMLFISSDSLELDSKEKQQLYVSLKGAFSAIVCTLKSISTSHPNAANMETDLKFFVSATIRALAAWMSQDPSAHRDAIADLAPFVLNFANETFYTFKTYYEANKHKGNRSDSSASQGLDRLREINLLRLLLPGLCHLTVDNKARRLLLDMKQAEVLLDCVKFHWSVVNYKKPPVPRADRLKAKVDVPIPPEILEDMKDSREAMASLCNIFMNLTALEPDLIESDPTFETLLKFIIESLTDLKDIPENLVLHGNMSVLGLLLIKQRCNNVSKNDFTLYRFIQSTIRFLWDAYNIDESNDSSTLVVSMNYKPYWIELCELWFLGMQTLSNLIKLIPWTSEFAVDSGWIDGIIKTLSKVRMGTLEPNVKSAYEDFLCSIVEANSALVNTLKKDDNVLRVCRAHKFMDFGKRIFGR